MLFCDCDVQQDLRPRRLQHWWTMDINDMAKCSVSMFSRHSDKDSFMCCSVSAASFIAYSVTLL